MTIRCTRCGDLATKITRTHGHERPLCDDCEARRECATREFACGMELCKAGCYLLTREGWHWDDTHQVLVQDRPLEEYDGKLRQSIGRVH